MKRLSHSPAVKVIAALLFALLVFSGSLQGLEALSRLPYLDADSWQETGRFRGLLQEMEWQAASAWSDTQALEEEGLSYMERQQITQRLEEAQLRLDTVNTNFRFQIRSADGQEILYTNHTQGGSLAQTVQTVHYAAFCPGMHYAVSSMDELRDIMDQQFQSNAEDGQEHILQPAGADQNAGSGPAAPPILVIECGVPALLSGQVQDEFYRLSAVWQASQNEFPEYFGNCVFLLGLALICLLFLLWTAGRRPGAEEAVLSWQERIPFDLYLAAALCAIAAALVMGWELCAHLYHYSSEALQGGSYLELFQIMLQGGALLATLTAAAGALTLRTLAVRLKAGNLLQTTLLCRVVQWMARAIQNLLQLGKELIRAVPFLWKGIVAYGIYFFANVGLYSNARYNGFSGILWFLLHAALLLLLCWWSMGFRRLRQGSQAIAAGNLNHQIDTRRMPYDLRCHAEDLNNISVGLAGAVDEKMKSERFKAELITNVSHDLKTPLTSIINYVSLLKTTQQTDPKALEYIEVLDRKSQRLKKLTEDLVEASKASTGVLSVNREKIGMSQLIDQALGEWTEKLESRRLALVTSLPEGETWVYADGRHLWRVIDNLLSNCAKYAMEGTRIYLDLARGKGQVSLSVKNISREPLNIPPERLMERFVRGEESRTTEGSGLGLSIARSLTELQGGQFDLVVDGDLFKAIVTLPQAS